MGRKGKWFSSVKKALIPDSKEKKDKVLICFCCFFIILFELCCLMIVEIFVFCVFV